MIRLEHVRFAYAGGVDILDLERLELPRGLVLLLGPNGAGKSTLLRLMAGVERPRQGRVFVDGLDLWADEVAARRRLAYVPEQPELTPYATIAEIVRLVCRLRGVGDAAGDAAIARVGLQLEAGHSVRELSQGQRRRAVLAAALVAEPPVLLLDEPLEAMDRAMRDDILAWIREAASSGRTAVVATHEFDELASAARAAVGMCRGRATLHALPDEAPLRARLLDRLARGADPH